jgi:hypothetical protein
LLADENIPPNESPPCLKKFTIATFAGIMYYFVIFTASHSLRPDTDILTALT